MSAVIVPIRPKETRLERFFRLEAERLRTRRVPTRCGRCGYRMTSAPTGLCRPCERRP